MNSIFYLEPDKNINSIHSLIHLFVYFQQIVIGSLAYARHSYVHWGYNSKQNRQKMSALIDIILGRDRSKKKKWYMSQTVLSSYNRYN